MEMLPFSEYFMRLALFLPIRSRIRFSALPGKGNWASTRASIKQFKVLTRPATKPSTTRLSRRCNLPGYANSPGCPMVDTSRCRASNCATHNLANFVFGWILYRRERRTATWPGESKFFFFFLGCSHENWWLNHIPAPIYVQFYNMYWLKVCSQEFWHILSGLDIQL